MKNVAKLEETRKALEAFKESTTYLFEEAEEKEEEGIESKSYQKAFLNALKTTQLNFEYKRGVVVLNGLNVGNYVQPIKINKRRVNVVPVCCLIELYKECIKDIPEAKSSEIPFTLRGFWKQDKTVECVTELFALVTKSILSLSSYINYKDVSAHKKKEINDLINLLKEFQVSPLKYDKYPYIEVSYREERFVIINTNKKADVVPLSKMICRYYYEAICSINKCMDGFDKYSTRLEKVHDDYMDFMKKYFIPDKLVR